MHAIDFDMKRSYQSNSEPSVIETGFPTIETWGFGQHDSRNDTQLSSGSSNNSNMEYTGATSSTAGSIWGLVGTVLSSITSLISSNQQYKRNRALMAYQAELNEAAAQNDYERAQKLLRDERLYNLPVNVRARIQAGGFSPGVMLANQGGAMVTASSPTPQNTATSKGSGLNGMATGFSSPMDVSQVGPLALAQARLASAEANKVESETQTSEMYQTRYSAEINKLFAEAGNQEAQTLWTDYQRLFEQSVQNLRKGTVKAQYDNLLKEGVKTISETVRNFAAYADTAAHARLLDLQLNTEIINQAFLRSKIALTDAQTNLANAQTSTESAKYRMFSSMAEYYMSTSDWQKFYNKTMTSNFKDFKHGERTTFGEQLIREFHNTTSNTASTWTKSTTAVIDTAAGVVGQIIGGMFKTPRPVGYKK